MPTMTGTEFLQRAARRRPRASLILLTGCATERGVAELVNQSCAWKFVAKPWNDEEMVALVERGFARYERNGAAPPPD
jgi:response regulator RpfG family c-di-GMP phosphodiesterase